MYIKVLIDNLSADGLIAEWGLAIYIEHEGHKFLLDTGKTGEFVQNAADLGIDLSEVEYGILSHAHYDHADGMARFLEMNKKASFYLRKGADENCYRKKKIFYKYIGIAKGMLEEYKDRIVYAEGDYELVPGVYLIPHKTKGLDKIGKKARMYVKKNHRLYIDSFEHEQSLVFDTKDGLVIFNSCSHGGADNIIKEVSATFPNKKINMLIGGLHLYRSSEEEIRALAARIKETGIKKVVTGHCTGTEAFDILKQELSDTVEQLYTGMDIK